MSDSRGADEVIDLLVDDGSWRAWDDPADVDPAWSADYREALSRARERSGADESVRTGVATVGGRPIVLVVSEFRFLGGSIGRVAGQRIAGAIRRATAEGLPVLALPASGGTRMQEGTPAFLQMATITAAVIAHRTAGLPYLVHLRHPTTGGVFASWGSLGQVTTAEPGALVGFLGPRVYAGLYGKEFPDGVQQAENLDRHGLIDAVVSTAQLSQRISKILAILAESVQAGPAEVHGSASAPGATWDAVLATRRDDRPGLAELLSDSAVILRQNAPLWLALEHFGRRTALVVGQDRALQSGGRLPGPADLRVAQRGMRLAAELGLPVVTVIDTPGAELSVAAEEGGLAAEIATCLADLIGLPVRTVSVLLGQGAGGAALALFPADHRLAATDAWLSPLPPEGASIIVHHDVDHAPQLADDQGIGAPDLLRTNIIDDMVDVDATDGMGALRVAIAAAIDGEPSPNRRARMPAAC